MVLQDSNSNTSDDLTDDAYSTGHDSYTPSSSLTNMQFDPSSFPRPIPTFGLPLGFSQRALRTKAQAMLQIAEQKIGRPLNADESQAIAYHTYSLEQAKSYFAVAGAGLGIRRWYKTWDTLRYPFWQPQIDKIDPNKFLFVRGSMATYARQSWRFALYALVSGHVASIIGQAASQPYVTSQTAADPRLKQLGNDLRAMASARGNRGAQIMGDSHQHEDRVREQIRSRTGSGPSPQARWGKQESVKTEEDDSSPTAGSSAWAPASPSTESWDTFSNETSQTNIQKTPNRLSNESRMGQPPSRQPAETSSSPFFDDDNDASPTGGFFQDEVHQSQAQTQSQSQSRPGESTWDRLRRGGASAPLQRPQQNNLRRAGPEQGSQREGNLGDPYNFGESEEDRAREKKQAQQEFDARLERERQGRDFESGENKRW